MDSFLNKKNYKNFELDELQNSMNFFGTDILKVLDFNKLDALRLEKLTITSDKEEIDEITRKFNRLLNVAGVKDFTSPYTPVVVEKIIPTVTINKNYNIVEVSIKQSELNLGEGVFLDIKYHKKNISRDTGLVYRSYVEMKVKIFRENIIKSDIGHIIVLENQGNEVRGVKEPLILKVNYIF